MDSDKQRVVVAELLEVCKRNKLAYKEGMKLLIIAAGFVAELETSDSQEDMSEEFINACNFALKEYKNYSDESEEKQTVPPAKGLH